MPIPQLRQRAILVIYFLCVSVSFCFAGNFSSPRETFEYYKASLKRGDVAAADSCFTAESLSKGRRHMKAYMQTLYLAIGNRQYRIEEYGNRAIVRWVPPDPTQQEFYLVKEKGAWKIDCQFMFDNIVYDQNHRCMWRKGDPGVEQRWMSGNYP